MLEDSIFVAICMGWDKTWLEHKKHVFYTAKMKSDAQEVAIACEKHQAVVVKVVAIQKRLPRNALMKALTKFAVLIDQNLNIRFEAFGLRSMLNWIRKTSYNVKDCSRTPSWAVPLIEAYKTAPGVDDRNDSNSDEEADPLVPSADRLHGCFKYSGLYVFVSLFVCALSHYSAQGSRGGKPYLPSCSSKIQASALRSKPAPKARAARIHKLCLVFFLRVL